jgi:hypothetical protein
MLPCSQLFQCSHDLEAFAELDLKLLRCLGLVSCLLTLEHPLPEIEHSICCVASLLVSWSSNQSTSRHSHTRTASTAGPSQSLCTLHTGRIETERQFKKFKDSRTPRASCLIAVGCNQREYGVITLTALIYTGGITRVCPLSLVSGPIINEL